MGIVRSDDLDEPKENDVERVTFGLDDKAYRIDLGGKNRQRLREVLRPFVTVATPYAEMPEPPQEVADQPIAARPEPATTNGTRRPRPTGAGTEKPRGKGRGTAAKAGTEAGKAGSGPGSGGLVRAWAKTQGIPVSPSGRISKEVLDKYSAANPE